MRRHGALSLAIGLLACALHAPRASAGVTIDILFVAQNGSAIAPTTTVSALPGDVLVMSLVMRNDEPLITNSFSLLYDLDGDDELDPLHRGSWTGVALNKNATVRYSPLGFAWPTTPQLVGPWASDNRGSRTSFLPPAAGAYAGGYSVGTVGWKVKSAVNSDGQDIRAGLNPGLDGFIVLDSDIPPGHESSDLEFHGATVDAVPEPGTAALLSLGLLALRLGRPRRSRGCGS